MDNNTTINDYIFFDVETPNLHHDSICQIGISYGDGRDSFCTLVNPHDYFDNINTHKHGIRERDVIDAPNWEEVWEILRTDFESKILVAYNAHFDLTVLGKILARNGIKNASFRYVDALKLAKERHCFTTKEHGLKEICLQLGIELGTHHNALCDALACHDVFQALDGTSFPVSLFTINDQTFDFGLRPSDVKEVCIAEGQHFFQALCGIVFALKLECANVNIQKQLIEWYESKKDLSNAIIVENIEAVLTIIDSKFSQESIIKLNDLLEKEHQDSFYSINALDAFFQCFLTIDNKKKYINQVNLFLTQLPNKEQPSNYKRLLELTQTDNKIDLLLDEVHYFLNSDKRLDDQIDICFQDKIFVLSGDFWCSKSEFGERIERKGGIVRGTVSKKTDYLILGETNASMKRGNKGGTKIMKAEEYGIPIISEERINELLGMGSEDSDVPF